MLAKDYAEFYGITAQQKDEHDIAFRNRVANELRKRGKLIEAHEAYQDKRYEDSDSVMTGIVGAIAQAMQGVSYRGDQVGNDIATGVIAQNPKDDISPEMALLAALLLGR